MYRHSGHCLEVFFDSTTFNGTPSRLALYVKKSLSSPFDRKCPCRKIMNAKVRLYTFFSKVRNCIRICRHLSIEWIQLSTSIDSYYDIAAAHKIMKRDVAMAYATMRKIHYNVMRFRDALALDEAEVKNQNVMLGIIEVVEYV